MVDVGIHHEKPKNSRREGVSMTLVDQRGDELYGVYVHGKAWVEAFFVSRRRRNGGLDGV